MRNSTKLLLCTSLAISIACGRRGTGGNDDKPDAPPFNKLIVKPESSTVTVALGATANQSYQVIGVKDGVETDITIDCLFELSIPLGSFNGAVATLSGRGGQTDVKATCSGQQASAALLNVNITGSIVVPGAPSNSAEQFTNATTTVDVARTPVLQYPIDGAVAPINLASVEVQWSAQSNDLFHVAMASQFVQIDVYTTSIDTVLSSTDWDTVVTTAAGRDVKFVVEGLTQSAATKKYTSATTTLTISKDAIDKTNIYYWASSQGSIMSSKFGSTAQPTQVKGDCTSCHSLSRTGTRFGYSRCVGGDCGKVYLGFMRFNKTSGLWEDTMDANNRGVEGSYTTYAPVGNPYPTDDKAVVMATKRGGTLGLFDPDTGVEQMSNVGEMASHGPGAPRAALMADWSADGSTIVYSSTPHQGQFIDLSDGAIAKMSYSYATGSHVFGEPEMLVKDPITLPGGVYNNFFFPSQSPDGKFTTFNAARSQWRNFSDAKAAGQRLMIIDMQTKAVTDLTALNGGNVDSDITWPHWAPGSTSDYYWVVFSSQRDYGHILTSANTAPGCLTNAVKQCKQIWIAAISKAKLAAGGGLDPSAPPMWLPGQSIAADNISPFWTVPAGVE
jgi:hypothetical protein